MNIISNNELHYSFLFQLEFCLEKSLLFMLKKLLKILKMKGVEEGSS